MQDDPSKQVDPEHPVMRMLSAFFDTAVECGLTKREVIDTLDAILPSLGPNGPIEEPLVEALSARMEGKGVATRAEFQGLLDVRLAPLLRESAEALGMDERGD